MEVDLIKTISKKCICDLKARTKNEVIDELIELIRKTGENMDFQMLKECITHREELMSTGIGLGVGVPHVRMEGIDEPFITIGISREGISDYESLDNEPVKLIILIVAGIGQHRQYLSLLSKIVRIVKREGQLAQSLSTKTIDEVYSIFTEEFAY